MTILDFSDLAHRAESEQISNALSEKTRLFLGDIKKAVYQHEPPDSFLANARSIEDEDLQQHLGEARKLIEQGYFFTAELLLTGILELRPSSEVAMLRLAELNERNGTLIRTLQVTSALELKGVYNEEIAYQHAFALFGLGRHEEALESILPLYIHSQSPRVSRLYGLILKSLGAWSDAIEILEKTIKNSPKDVHSLRALSELHSELGFYQKSLEILRQIPHDLTEDGDKLGESLMLRMMGELNLAIKLNSEIIASNPGFSNALWTQCFNYSIAASEFARDLVKTSQRFWQLRRQETPLFTPIKLNKSLVASERVKIAFLSSDIGEHVVSRFMTPILRHYNRDKYHITLLSTHRRFEEKATEIVSYADAAISLQGLTTADVYACLEDLQANVIIETNGFTRNSGIGLLAQRCAPIQCHYIGYHATTGLDTIDYFLGDPITVPDSFQRNFTEQIVQIPSLWMAYDAAIEFPTAASTAQRDCPVLGSFSQITKINQLTLNYWAAALNAVPDSILVIKDRGCYCSTSCQRIENTLQSLGVDPKRVYFIAPVATHLDHLDSYKAIDIALDTTPWSSATTAFEALGMGVPLVAICGDTTAGRMSTSVVSAAGRSDLIAHSKEQFASIVTDLSRDYKKLRDDKASMQKQIRSGILFNEQRICRDFCATIDRLVANHPHAGENRGKR